MGRKMVKPRFYVESQIWKKTPIYLVSGTTIQHYIVPSFKEQLLCYKNPVLDLFCQVGWTNSLNNAFSRVSSSTTLFIFIPRNFPWSFFLPSKNKMFALALLDSIMDINNMLNSCHQLYYISQSKIDVHILVEVIFAGGREFYSRAGSSVRVLKYLSRRCCLCNYNAVAESLPGNWRS